MEHGQNQRTAAKVVVAGRLAEQTVNALSDESSRRILVSTISSGKTVQEISEEQAIPMSTCYRRAHELVDQGLLVTERIVVTADGKRFAVFRSSFRTVEIASDMAEISVSAELNEEVADRFHRKLLDLMHPELGI